MRENPAVSGWVRISGGSTEGMLGELAGAAAGGAQGMLAAGHGQRSSLIVRAVLAFSISRANNGWCDHRARFLPWEIVDAHQLQFTLPGDDYLMSSV